MIACVVENEQIVLVNTLILFVCLFIFASWFCFVYAVILRQCLTGVAVVGLELSVHTWLTSNFAVVSNLYL